MQLNPSKAVLFLFLLTESLFDLKNREINLTVLAVTAVCGVWVRTETGSFSVPQLLAGLFPGLLLLCTAFFTKGKVGAGDGLVLLAASLFDDWSGIITAFFLSLLLSSGYAVICLTIRKKGRQTSFPYIPFLAAGYLGSFLLLP